MQHLVLIYTLLEMLYWYRSRYKSNNRFVTGKQWQHMNENELFRRRLRPRMSRTIGLGISEPDKYINLPT